MPLRPLLALLASPTLFGLALAAGALALPACGDEPPDPAETALVPEADVERVRAEAFRETIGLDADLARFEAEAAATDSFTAAGYGPVLDRLRAERRSLQARIDTLGPTPRARFDSLSARLLADTRALRRSVRRGRVEGAPSFPALQAVAARDLGALDARIARLRAVAAADTTGRLLRDVDSLAADRARLAARVGAYPDTTDAQFPPFRRSVTDALLGLERRADALEPDSLADAAASRPDA